MANLKRQGFFRPNKFKIYLTLAFTLLIFSLPIWPNFYVMCAGLGCSIPPISRFESIYHAFAPLWTINAPISTIFSIMTMFLFGEVVVSLILIGFLYLVSCLVFSIYRKVAGSGA